MMQSTTRTTRFARFSKCAWGLLVIAFAPGCSICCQPYLDDYVAFGSRVPRTDMKHGRVGSPFSDPNSQIVVEQGELPYYEGQVEEVIEEGVVGDAEVLEIHP
ncbi:MAG: hypothetical protein MUD03_12455 [Pirellula sp.]|nr:hypothetical protein [Pirellula sp.]